MSKPEIYLQHLDSTNLILWREGAQLSIGIYDDKTAHPDNFLSISLSVNLDNKDEHEGEAVFEEHPRWQEIGAFIEKVNSLLEARGLFGPEHSRSLSQILSTEQPIQYGWTSEPVPQSQQLDLDASYPVPEHVLPQLLPPAWLIRVANSQKPKNKYQEAIQKLAKDVWHGRKTWDPAQIMRDMRMHIEKLHLIHTRCTGVSISDDLAYTAEADALHFWVTDVVNVTFYKIGEPLLHARDLSVDARGELVYAGEEGAGND